MEKVFVLMKVSLVAGKSCDLEVILGAKNLVYKILAFILVFVVVIYVCEESGIIFLVVFICNVKGNVIVGRQVVDYTVSIFDRCKIRVVKNRILCESITVKGIDIEVCLTVSIDKVAVRKVSQNEILGN